MKSTDVVAAFMAHNVTVFVKRCCSLIQAFWIRVSLVPDFEQRHVVVPEFRSTDPEDLGC